MMKKTITILIMVIAAYLILFSCDPERPGGSLRTESYDMLITLSNALLTLQIDNESDPDFGALRCPECNILHTRAAEAVFPFAVLYEETKDEKYADAAVDLGNWLIRQQLGEGEWKETPWEWTGTTADQLLMMVQAYPILKDQLTSAEKDAWIKSISCASDYLVKYMSPEFASINYCPTSAAALAKVSQLIPNERYARKARELARRTVAKFDDDGFIHGEAARIYDIKYGVDIGYEIDMSLWGLGLYAKIMQDTLVENIVKQSVREKLNFIYPDGAVEASWGSRMYKWTTFGSKTADGCQVMFALFNEEDPRYHTAALLNLRYLKQFIRDGFIGNGPQYWEMYNGTVCNYPTFARAKNMAMTFILADAEEKPMPELPMDQKGWYKYYPTVDVALIRMQNYTAVLSAYGYRDIVNWGEGKYTHRPSGGSLLNVWVDGYGFLQSSSQTRYVRGEIMHMPAVDDTIISITPRIEFRNKNGYFTNLYECEGQVDLRTTSGRINSISTTGELKNELFYPGGIGYTLTHRFFDDAIEKDVLIRFHDDWSEVAIIEPFINWQGSTFTKINDSTVTIHSKQRRFTFSLLSGNATLLTGKNIENYWMPFPAMKAYPVILKVKPGIDEFRTKITYRISIDEN